MKRFIATLAFLFGGITAEITKPLSCTLMASSQLRVRRPKLRYNNGKY